MFTIHQQVTIQRPSGEIFAFLADPANIPRWRPDVVETRAATSAPLEVGSTYDEVVNFGGPKAQTFQVTALQANRCLEVTAVAGLNIRPTQRYTLTVDGVHTTVSMEVHVRTGGVFRLMEPLLPRMISAKWRTYAGRLRELLENQTVMTT